MEENRSEEQVETKPDKPAYSTKTWRACCLAPTIAVVAVLLLSVIASLYNTPRPPSQQRPQAQNKANPQRREAFVQFGKEFFAIAVRADEINEAAFRELDAYIRGSGSIENVHAVFSRAAPANNRASKEFKRLAVPSGLVSESKLRQSCNTMSQSYDARKQACEIIIGWNGDLQDRTSAESYQRQANVINQLTMQGLRQLGEAADDNGLTKDDVQRFLPPASMKIEIFGIKDMPLTN